MHYIGEPCECGHYKGYRDPCELPELADTAEMIRRQAPQHSIYQCQVCSNIWIRPNHGIGEATCLQCKISDAYWCKRCRLIWCLNCESVWKNTPARQPIPPLWSPEALARHPILGKWPPHLAGDPGRRHARPGTNCTGWKGQHWLYCRCENFIGEACCDCHEYARRHGGRDQVRPENEDTGFICKAWIQGVDG